MVAPDRLVHGNLAATLEDVAVRGGWSGSCAYRVDTAAYTYGELYAGMREVAGVFAAHGIGADDRVLLALSDGIDLVWAFLATLWLGAVAVMVNPRLREHELASAAARCEPGLVMCDDALLGSWDGFPALPSARVATERRAAAPVPARIRAATDPAYALFTSGTTGEPKLCFHAHRDALVYDRAFGRPVLTLRPGDVTLSASKAYFAYGLGNSVFYPLLSGATAVLTPDAPTADRILAAVARFDVRVLYAVPSLYARLLHHPGLEAMASVELAVCAGEILPRAVEDAFSGLGPVLLNGIGSTEVGQTFASNAPSARRQGTVGRALPPYRVRVVGDDGEDVPLATEGRLLVNGSTVTRPSSGPLMRMMPDLSSWHSTGDLAALDEDGYLRVSGRHDDIEIVGGINLRPTEVEELIAGYALVSDVAVCAVTDARGVSRLVAYVVPGASGHRPAIATDLLDALRPRVASYKVPSEVIMVDELPRTYTGKLKRRLLREMAARHQETGIWPLAGSHRREEAR
jgi:4-hydroxybenzoate adenylyltransferase